MFVSFVVVQFAPAAPIERVIAQISGSDTGAPRASRAEPAAIFGARRARRKNAGGATNSNIAARKGSIRNSSRALEKQFGFDKPAYERFFIMLKNFSTFDFGKSYFAMSACCNLVKEKLPVRCRLESS